MTAELDPYSALELAPGSTLEQVKEQYRRLAKANHPDLNPQDRSGSEERLRRLNAAYAVLSDPAHKAMLDWRWERKQTARATPPESGTHSTGLGARPARRPRPAPSGGKSAPPKVASAARKAPRPLTRAERRRIRVTAASVGLAMSLTVVGVVYYEWAQPAPQERIGIAPTLGDGTLYGGMAAHAAGAPMEHVTSIPLSAPSPDSAPADLTSSRDLRMEQIQQVLQRRMDDVEPKITELISDAQTAVNADPPSPPASPERIRWRSQLMADSRQVLVQRGAVRLEIEDLSWSEPQARQDALARIKQDSQVLDQQFRHLREELRQKPL